MRSKTTINERRILAGQASVLEMDKYLLSPPGDTILEHLEFIGMSQAELAERMGRPKEKINDIIKAREPITTATAFQLEKVLNIPAVFWMNSEASYRKKLYEIQLREKLGKEKDWLDSFPIKEMKKLGWLPDKKEKYILADSLLKFFCVASIDEWKRIYIDKKISVAFRMSLARTKSPHSFSVWLRRGEIQSGEIELTLFNKKNFLTCLNTLRGKRFVMSEKFQTELKIMCAKSGVALVFTEELPKAPISGAARWFHNKPLIQLQKEYKTVDQFRFTFYHEAAHILLHGKKDIFLENVTGADMDRVKEEEADAFARRFV